jgi:hypothetical protein
VDVEWRGLYVPVQTGSEREITEKNKRLVLLGLAG